MKIIEKLNLKNKDIYRAKPVTIAFLGDSVTQGCFDCFFDENGQVQTYFDYKSAYSTRVKEILNIIYPSAQINIINSGLSGDSAPSGNDRFERDVAPYNPDLVIVAFGLNDCCNGVAKVNEYTNALKSIFEKVKNIGAECIYMFPNMMNTRVSCHLNGEKATGLAEFFAKIQKDGTIDLYHEKAIETALSCGVTVCDVYSAWKTMEKGGVDITELLANKYNHPIAEFHYYMAIKLVEKMLEINV